MDVGTESSPRSSASVNGWSTASQEYILYLADRADLYRIMNAQAADYYERLRQMIMVPVIVFSSMAALSNWSSFAAVLSESVLNSLVLMSAILGTVATVLTALANFYQFDKSISAHREAQDAYGKIVRKIMNVVISQKPHHRPHFSTFLAEQTDLYSQLSKTSDTVPAAIRSRCLVEFNTLRVHQEPLVRASSLLQDVRVDVDSAPPPSSMVPVVPATAETLSRQINQVDPMPHAIVETPPSGKRPPMVYTTPMQIDPDKLPSARAHQFAEAFTKSKTSEKHSSDRTSSDTRPPNFRISQ